MLAVGSSVGPYKRLPKWPIPKEWDGGRCFVICSGHSLKAQLPLIAKLKGRFVAVKHGVYARPDADVLFISGEGTYDVADGLIAAFSGKYVIVRGKADSRLPSCVHRVARMKDHSKLSILQNHVAGYDSGTSAINVATLFGATEVIVLGYDMTGGHYCPHPLQNPPSSHFIRHMVCLPALAADAKRRGIRIVNCSPISAVTVFEKQPLEAFL